MIIRTVILLALLIAGSVQASMVLDRTIIEFEPGAVPRQDVSVFNPGDNPLFIKVEVLEVSDPGTPDERREAVRDPQAIGFIATPRRLTVPAGARRLVRLVNLKGHGAVERVYRVNLRPVPPPLESDTMAIRVMIAYQLLIFVKPANPVVKFDARREGDTLHLHNSGNVNVRLFDGRQCVSGGPVDGEDCQSVRGRRLYPGNEVELALPLDRPVSFRVEAEGRRNRRTFE